MSKLGILAVVTPALFVLAPACLVAWYASHPATPAEIRAHRMNEEVQRKIRRCSIGLDRDTCARAFYCSSDPAQCARLMAAEPADDDRAAY